MQGVWNAHSAKLRRCCCSLRQASGNGALHCVAAGESYAQAGATLWKALWEMCLLKAQLVSSLKVNIRSTLLGAAMQCSGGHCQKVLEEATLLSYPEDSLLHLQACSSDLKLAS